jgi:hypothetical protein
MRLLWVVEGKSDGGEYEPTVYVGTDREAGKAELAFMRKFNPKRLFRLVPYVPGAQRFRG